MKYSSINENCTISKQPPWTVLVLAALLLVQPSVAAPLPPSDNTSAPYMGFYGWNPFASNNPGWNYGINRGHCAATYLYRSNLWSESFCGHDTWANLAMPSYILTGSINWLNQNPGGTLVLTMPLFPAGNTYAGCLTGTTATNNYRLAAERLVSSGLANNAVIRLSHEFNGGWYGWRVRHKNTDIDPATGNKYDDRPENFVALWQLCVNTMRAVPGAANLKFCWNGANTWCSYNVADAYPGDAYVDYVGIDIYDQSWAANSYPYTTSVYPYGSDAATRQQNAWNDISGANSNNGLGTWRNIAVAHGKPLAIPEWGLSDRTNTKTPDGHGGMDNPFFIQKMYDFIQDPANNVAFHVYFDTNMDDGIHQIVTYPGGSATSFPYGSAKLKQLFGIRLPLDHDIGTVGLAGSRDPVTVKGAGAGYLTGTSDNFHFSSRSLSGDGQFVAQITAMTSGTSTQSGIMLRENTAANARYAALFVSNGQCRFQSRTSTGGTATQNYDLGSVTLPVWLKLVRQGSVITGYRSSDGLNWAYAGSQTVSMTGTNNAGVAVSSGSTTALNTTGIDNVDNYDIPVSSTGSIANAIIKDNSDTTGIAKTGGWSNYTTPAGFYGANYLWLYHGGATSTITYTPTIPTAGRYDVYMRWAADHQRSSNVQVNINSTSGMTPLLCNQYVNAGLWNHLGTYDFAAGTAGNVFLTSAGVDGYAATADAVMFVPLPVPSLPAPKVDNDIGAPVTPGSAAYNGGVYTVKAAGTGFWAAGPNAIDQFNFVNQPMTGSQTLVARITGFTNTGTNASAGLMFRGSTAGGAVFAQVEINPAGGVLYMFRSVSGAASISTGTISTGVVPSPSTPIWLKLVKSGNSINGYYSTSVTTPATWASQGAATLSNMPANFVGGLAVHSHNASTLTTVTFDNVSP